MKRANDRKQSATWRICAVFAPQSTTDSTTTIDSTLQLLEPLAEAVFAITGNIHESAISSDKVHIINLDIKQNARSSILVRIPRFITLQLRLSYSLIKIASRVDIVFIAGGAAALVLPALSAKLLRKRVVLLRHGTDSFQEIIRADYQKMLFGMGRYIFPPIVHALIRLNCSLADRIAVFSPNITDPRLKEYMRKVSFSGSRFYVDIDHFKADKSPDQRENIVGYIGRFEEIKGVMNFVRAIPLVLKESPETKFILGGDGTLKSRIEQEIREAKLGSKVTLTGWISHDELPQYLNKIRLLVIPSYAEAGPHIVFEATACGTPVLATSVGIIPDVIKDVKTGFIMEDNSPECIARNIVRALNHPDLDRIVRAARDLIEREYTYEAAVGRYRSILATLK